MSKPPEKTVSAPHVAELQSAPGPAISGKTNCKILILAGSAGGLDAFTRLLRNWTDGDHYACLVVQHIGPSQQNLLVDLLSRESKQPTTQAKQGEKIQKGHVYIIPPGCFMSVDHGRIKLITPADNHGVRMPIDHLLASIAPQDTPRYVTAILSGTGTDGTEGILGFRKNGGFVLVQDPEQAEYAGMPESAIASGQFDGILKAEDMPAAITRHFSGRREPVSGEIPPDDDVVNAIVELLRKTTIHDFTHYKTGTLHRRIAQRMLTIGIAQNDMSAYLAMLESDANEASILSNDLLIHVTGFFRDPGVFKMLSEKTIPQLIEMSKPRQSLRLWVAGCSTGEEAYSIAMLILDELAKVSGTLTVQIFATDADPVSIAQARTGVFSAESLSALPENYLNRYFVRDESHYRVTTELRECVIFSVQDLLTDPPFSRLNFISCRNVLIYLSPAAQARVISIFHFALAEHGLLLLGNVETTGASAKQFELVSKKERLWRRVGFNRTPVSGFPAPIGNIPGSETGAVTGIQLSQASLCQTMIIENFAPAAVLINASFQCLYSLGPVERYLHVAPGYPTHDFFSMTDRALRTNIEDAIGQVHATGEKSVVTGWQSLKSGMGAPYDVIVLPVPSDIERLFLICFVDRVPSEISARDSLQDDIPRQHIDIVEKELKGTRQELLATKRLLEQVTEDQRQINEESLSFKEEYQSTNEELLTSKEELQSLNEELTVLNSQLQETLERQRTTSDDLQNVLYSTDVATVFLDTQFCIRFFTPATKALFNILASDIGRPLSDLKSNAQDENLIEDAAYVLANGSSLETELTTKSGQWYIRRISPYVTKDELIEGVVITFSEITESKHIAEDLEKAKRQAQTANAAKSRFLAAASHDLRQPLQTLTLLQGLLAQQVNDEKGGNLVSRLGETLDTMASMLNTLLDINQIEAGTVKANKSTFAIGPLLTQLSNEFDLHASAIDLHLTLVNSTLQVYSDPALLEQIIRNLLSNALKYTRRGRILFGCRRHGSSVSIEVWDTGIGIPESEFVTIFDEFHQLDNEARERNRGLGLGLSIVKRLCDLLGHKIVVKSRKGKGSAFAILLEQAADHEQIEYVQQRPPSGGSGGTPTHSILLVEDDPQLRELLSEVLTDAHYKTYVTTDGIDALNLVEVNNLKPDLIIADFNLPNGANGLKVADAILQKTGRPAPVLILTGDISTPTLREVSNSNYLLLNKPVSAPILLETIRAKLDLSAKSTSLALEASSSKPAPGSGMSMIYIVDDDSEICDLLRSVLEDDDRQVETFLSCEAFLAAPRREGPGCLLVDAYLPGMTGIELLENLKQTGQNIPAVMITGHSDVALAVNALKAGAVDFVEKPIRSDDLNAVINRALALTRDETLKQDWKVEAGNRISRLTQRQLEIMHMVLEGQPNKNIASTLGISQRTVENHRASIMKRTGSKSLPALARLALAAQS